MADDITTPIPTKPPREPRQSRRSTWDTDHSHVGHGATPKRIYDIFRSAEAGYPTSQCDLFEDILTSDPHLRGACDTRVDAVAGKPWFMQAGGPSQAEAEAASALEEALRRIPTLREMFEHLVESNFYGYAFGEQVVDLVDNVIVPVELVTVAHRRFKFDGKTPLLIVDNGDAEPLRPGSWISSTRRGRLPAAAGILRPASIWSTFKRIGIRDWLIFLERYGQPLAVGSHSPIASDDALDALESALSSLGKDGSAMISNDCKIDLQSPPPGSADVYLQVVALVDAQVSKLISGATLLSETSGSASYAIGKVHQARGFDITAADANRLSLAFGRGVCEPFMRWNGYPGRAPVLRFNIAPETDPATRMKLYTDAANLGMSIDETQFREDFGFNFPAEGAPVLEAPKPPAPGVPAPSDEGETPNEGPADPDAV